MILPKWCIELTEFLLNSEIPYLYSDYTKGAEVIKFAFRDIIEQEFIDFISEKQYSFDITNNKRLLITEIEITKCLKN